MPFGKFRGEDLADIPDGYLNWLLDECNLRPRLRNAVKRELETRDEDAALCRCMAPVLPESLIWDWYRGLAMDYHPDRGGSVEAMKVINEAHARLKKLVGLAS
jgi:hypothetical protein